MVFKFIKAFEVSTENICKKYIFWKMQPCGDIMKCNRCHNWAIESAFPLPLCLPTHVIDSAQQNSLNLPPQPLPPPPQQKIFKIYFYDIHRTEILLCTIKTFVLTRFWSSLLLVYFVVYKQHKYRYTSKSMILKRTSMWCRRRQKHALTFIWAMWGAEIYTNKFRKYTNRWSHACVLPNKD